MLLASIYKNPVEDYLVLVIGIVAASSALYFSVRALFNGFVISPGSVNYSTAKPKRYERKKQSAQYWTWVLIYGFIGIGWFFLLFCLYCPKTFHRLF